MGYAIKVLVAPQRDHVFKTLSKKAKIIEEFKHVEREKRDKERRQNKNKRDSSPSTFAQWPKKRVRFDRPS